MLAIVVLLTGVGIAGLLSYVGNRHTYLYLYKGGLLLSKRRDRSVQVMRWEEIDSVIWRVSRSPRNSRETYIYTVYGPNNCRFNLTHHFERYQELFARIDNILVRDRLPALRDRYLRGETLNFGAIALSQEELTVRYMNSTTFYSWSEITSLDFAGHDLRQRVPSARWPVFVSGGSIRSFCLLEALLEESGLLAPLL